MFGPHLTIDMYGCEKSKLTSVEYIYKMLDELPDMLGMHKVSDPQIIPYDGREDSFDKGGISAFVIIAESHIAIHTFEAQNYASVDIFSCKEFDREMAIRYFVEKFRAKKIEHNLTMRGRDFPKDLKKATVIAKNQRRRVEETA